MPQAADTREIPRDHSVPGPRPRTKEDEQEGVDQAKRLNVPLRQFDSSHTDRTAALWEEKALNQADYFAWSSSLAQTTGLVVVGLGVVLLSWGEPGRGLCCGSVRILSAASEKISHGGGGCFKFGSGPPPPPPPGRGRETGLVLVYFWGLHIYIHIYIYIMMYTRAALRHNILRKVSHARPCDGHSRRRNRRGLGQGGRGGRRRKALFVLRGGDGAAHASLGERERERPVGSCYVRLRERERERETDRERERDAALFVDMREITLGHIIYISQMVSSLSMVRYWLK